MTSGVSAPDPLDNTTFDPLDNTAIDAVDDTVELRNDSSAPPDNPKNSMAPVKARAALPPKKSSGSDTKGFLLSARNARDLPPTDEGDNVYNDDLKHNEDADGSPETKLKPKKKGAAKKKGTGKASGKDGVGKSASRGSREEDSDAGTPSSKIEGMISRRPGSLDHFLPSTDIEEEDELAETAEDVSGDAASQTPEGVDAGATANPTSGTQPKVSVTGPSSQQRPGEAVPAMWQQSQMAQGEVQGLKVMDDKKNRVSRMMTRKKKSAVKGFHAKQKLAYYGSIGGGFGTPRVGFAPGQFNTPTWMSTMPSGNLVVSSTFAHEVQVLTPRGAPASVLTEFHGRAFVDPQGIVVTSTHLFVADGGNGRVVKFRIEYKEPIDFTPELATCDGMMDLPQGLAYHEDGQNSILFAVCGRSNRVQVLRASDLSKLYHYGAESNERAATACQLNNPTCVAIYNPIDFSDSTAVVFGGRSRKLIYVTDTENDRLAGTHISLHPLLLQ